MFHNISSNYKFVTKHDVRFNNKYFVYFLIHFFILIIGKLQWSKRNNTVVFNYYEQEVDTVECMIYSLDCHWYITIKIFPVSIRFYNNWVGQCSTAWRTVHEVKLSCWCFVGHNSQAWIRFSRLASVWTGKESVTHCQEWHLYQFIGILATKCWKSAFNFGVRRSLLHKGTCFLWYRSFARLLCNCVHCSHSCLGNISNNSLAVIFSWPAAYKHMFFSTCCCTQRM